MKNNNNNSGFSATVAAMLAKNTDVLPNAAVAVAMKAQQEAKAKEDAVAAGRVLAEIESYIEDGVRNLRRTRKTEELQTAYVKASEAAGVEFTKTGDVTAWHAAFAKAREALNASSRY